MIVVAGQFSATQTFSGIALILIFLFLFSFFPPPLIPLIFTAFASLSEPLPAVSSAYAPRHHLWQNPA
jgi:hypothetical protein